MLKFSSEVSSQVSSKLYTVRGTCMSHMDVCASIDRTARLTAGREVGSSKGNSEIGQACVGGVICYMEDTRLDGLRVSANEQVDCSRSNSVLINVQYWLECELYKTQDVVKQAGHE